MTAHAGDLTLLDRIEIAGCIASGKTTLAQALAGRFRTVYEDHQVNPFWEAFYADPSAHAFETEISFLLQHYHFAKAAAISSPGVIMLDHSFELDMAYAMVGLAGSKREIFESIYREIQKELGIPRTVVFVRCGAEEIVRRIRERGRAVESEVPLEFLSKLQRELERRIGELSSFVPIIQVNAEKTDFRKKGRWLAKLGSELESYLEGGQEGWKETAAQLTRRRT